MPKKGRHPSLIIFVIVAAFYLAGAFAPIDRAVRDALFEIARRDAAKQVVLVEIDSKSLRRLDVWPWVRSYHARVLNRLVEAGAVSIAFDIDFSSRTVAAQDRALADAIRAADGRVVLPVFRQQTRNARGDVIETVTGPMRDFARAAKLGSVNVPMDPDGRIRQYPTSSFWNGRDIPSMAARLAALPPAEADTFNVDFGIQAHTIPRLSFVDVMNGKFDPGVVAGKVVIVGATATELGDRLPVPIYGVLPGPVFQAMAYESIVQGRMIHGTNAWVTLLIAMMIAAFLGRWYAKVRARTASIVSVAFVPMSFALAVGIQWVIPLSLDIAAWCALALGSYLVHLLLELDRRTLQIFVHRLSSMHRRAMLNSVVDDSFDGIIITDADGVIQLFNATAGRMLRIMTAVATGQRIETIVPEFTEFLARPGKDSDFGATPSGPGVRHEIDVIRQDGEAFSAELVINASKLRTSKKRSAGTDQILYIFTFRDITERKRIEAAERKAMEEAIAASRAKSEFLANVSHELRTPLNAIIGFSEMIQAEMFGPLGAPQYAEYMKDIHGSGSHLLEVINDILDMSKIESGQMELQERKITLGDVIRSCLRLIQERAGDADVTVESNLPEALPDLRADERMVKQILLNLLSNAVKFTQSGGAITVSCGVADYGGLVITVEDTGIGIAAEDLEQALAPFGQIDTRLSRVYEGTGLGLPLVKSMVELHGGTLALESKVGQGTKVTVTFGRDRVIKPGDWRGEDDSDTQLATGTH